MKKGYLGVEFGSTRIKAVLIDGEGAVTASGSHTWENSFENGLWTYSEEEIWNGLKACVSDLVAGCGAKSEVAAVGISAMMHGYVALDKAGNLLVPFRTWRNTNAGEAAEKLTKAFNFNIPMRWSIAHLYQAILNGEEHVKDISYLTTLAGYVHYKLTGEKVLGVGDASGMFPIDERTGDYDAAMLQKFDSLVADKGYPWKLKDILPKVLTAGEEAGKMLPAGTAYFSGLVEEGTPFCPPEGDAGTGMVATNSVKERTGNVSAGTSVFAMVVLEHALSSLHTEIDVVTTPDGKPVAMVHCNNCTSDINAWAGLFHEALALFGADVKKGELYEKLFLAAGEGRADCGGTVSYNYFSGEPVTGFTEGRPLVVRTPGEELHLSDFMKNLLYSSLASLSIGMEILHAEGVKTDELLGHGGFFKTPVIGQRVMSAAVGAPVAVMDNAGEGGAWGIALLAAYLKENCSLPEYLGRVFSSASKHTVSASEADKKDFCDYLKRYKAGLAVEGKAVEAL